MKDFLIVSINKYPYEEINLNNICEVRRKEIESNKSYNFIGEAYYSWRVAEIICETKLGIKLESLNPRRNEMGKWIIDKYHMSISHSGKTVMVAISTMPIGVDVQKERELYFDFFKDRMCMEESEYYKDKNPWECYIMHCEKEAIYKCYCNGPINWQSINTFSYKDRTICAYVDEYYYAICSDLIKEGIEIELYNDFERCEFDEDEIL